MASAAMFSSLRRRRSPSLHTFLAPNDLSDGTVLDAVCIVSAELVSSFFAKGKTTPCFQVRNFRSLIRTVQMISVLMDAFADMGMCEKVSSVFMCLKELYHLLNRLKILIDYVNESSKLWLLLQNDSISGHFHDLNQEISTILDVFPLSEIDLSEDVREQIELLRKQSRNSKMFIDKHDDLLRMKFYSFLNEFKNGNIPERNELYTFFVEKLGICNVKICRFEIEFLEEQIVNHDGDVEPPASVLIGFVALVWYCRFLLFRFEDEEGEVGRWYRKKMKKGLITQDISDTSFTIPKDFCCPISLELMKDPVIISTGQTYDRASIARWIEEKHSSCPKTGQMCLHNKLVPNRALRNLIMQWCMANGIPYDPPENAYYASENTLPAFPLKAAIEAIKATANLLVEHLENGSSRAKTVAAREIRLLAKTGRENRACIGEAGAMPFLKRLLPSLDAIVQENSVTAMLNLSIYNKNKTRIMDIEGCLSAIVDVLKNGHTTEARENAAATLFSLSAIHDYKKDIALENGAIEALAGLLRNGTLRGQKDAVMALFNLSTHPDNCEIMIEVGAITALVWALRCDGVSEEAAGALVSIVRQPIGAEAVGKDEMGLAGLIEMMRNGTSRGKENAVAALLELCRNGGPGTIEKVIKAPALAGLLQSLLFTGTKRAQRKAVSLARVFQRYEYVPPLQFGGFGYAISRNSVVSQDTSFAMPVSISQPVL